MESLGALERSFEEVTTIKDYMVRIREFKREVDEDQETSFQDDHFADSLKTDKAKLGRYVR